MTQEDESAAPKLSLVDGGKPKRVKRKGLSITVRFEVFKRDAFKCQYCGKSAPEVILQVDHIKPVSKGGENDLLNLITSCRECNGGKGARELSDSSALTKQRAMLEELNERREQLELLLKWREGLEDVEAMAADAIAERFRSLTGYLVNEHGMTTTRKWLRRFSLNEILDAIPLAVDNYMKRGDEDEAASVGRAFDKVPAIVIARKSGRDDGPLYYIRGIVRNRFDYCNQHVCITLLRQAHDEGVPHDELINLAKTAKSWSMWLDEMQWLIDEAGRGDGPY